MMGELMVNVPVTLIIIVAIIILNAITEQWNLSVIISSCIGWIVWSKFLKNWVNWGIKNSIEKERLYKLGKYGLINFTKSRIIKEEKTASNN